MSGTVTGTPVALSALAAEVAALLSANGGVSGALPLTGGTMAGPIAMGSNDLSGSAVAFSGGTMNGVTIGGTTPAPITATYGVFNNSLTVVGNATVESTLYPAAITQYGSGGTMALKLGAAASQFSFENSAGTSMLTIGGSNNLLNPQVTLNLGKPGTWSGASGSGNSDIFVNKAWTGDTTSAASPALNFLQYTDAINTHGGSLAALTVNLTSGGSTMTGTRQAGNFNLNIGTPSNNTAGSIYCGLIAKGTAICNDGGTGLTLATANSVIFGFNTVAQLGSSTANATYWSGVVSYEADVYCFPGSSVVTKIGIAISDLSPSGGPQGTLYDTALSFNNNATAPGWRTLLGIGKIGGFPPLDPVNGWIMQFYTLSGTGTQPGAGGFDFTGFVPTTAFMRWNNGLIDPSGNVTGNSFVVGSAGPTITSGSAVPSSTQPKGSLYTRTAGGVGTTLYVSQGGGTWNAVAGV